MHGQLTSRALNRTLLRRQLLDERRPRDVAGVLEHLVGMQAQVPRAPYAGLHGRIEGFAPEQLEELYERREVLRLGLMRATLHLVTRRDALRIRPVTQDVLERADRARPEMVRALAGVDLDAVRAAARELMARAPQSTAALREQLAERFPGTDGEAMARAVHFLEPVLQPPPRGLWHRTGQTTWVTVEDWLGEPVGTDTDPGELILRYLRAFGPATVADIATWSRLTGVRAHVDALDLEVIEDGRRTLYDVPGGELVPEDAPAPPRFLGEFDNVLVGWQDRSRIIGPEHRDVVLRALGKPMLLVDGFVRAMWKHDRGHLRITALDRFSAAEKKAIREEGKHLLALLARGAKRPRVEIA